MLFFKKISKPLFSNNKKISDYYYKTNSFLGKTIGLMFKLDIDEKDVFVFEFKNGSEDIIHTFFMFFPIDIVLLDRNKVVIQKFSNVKPWKIIKPKQRYYYVLEGKSIPASIGDKLVF